MTELSLVIIFIVIMVGYILLAKFCYNPIPVFKPDSKSLISKELFDSIPSLKELICWDELGFAGYDYFRHKWKSYKDMSGRLNFPESFDYYWDSEQERWRKDEHF